MSALKARIAALEAGAEVRALAPTTSVDVGAKVASIKEALAPQGLEVPDLPPGETITAWLKLTSTKVLEAILAHHDNRQHGGA